MEISTKNSGPEKAGFTGRQFLLVLLVFFIIILARSLYTAMPEMADAGKKWIIAVNLATSHDFSVLLDRDHHSSRWGIIFPVAASVKIFGNTIAAYYIPCLVLYGFLFTTLLGYGRYDIDRNLLFPFAVLLFFEPMFFRATSQIQPFIFGASYILISLLLISQYVEKQKVVFLVFAAVFAFAAYGCKESYLFFVVGTGILVLWKSGVRAAFIFSSVLVVLLAGETWFFNVISGDLRYGRIEFLSGGKHMLKMMDRDPTTVFNLVTHRWFSLPFYDKTIALVSGVYIIWVITTKRLSSLHTVSAGIILVASSYSLLISITPSSIDPLIPLQPLKIKYLTPVLPFLVYIAFLAASGLLEQLAIPTRKTLYFILNLLVLLFLAYSIVFGSPVKYALSYAKLTTMYPDRSAIVWRYREMNRGLHVNLGICARRTATLELVTRRFIEQFFNDDQVARELKVSHRGGIRVLHHRAVDIHSIDSFAYNDSLFRQVTWQDCLDRYGK